MSLVGRLHRVYRYDAFACLEDARSHVEGLAGTPERAAFLNDYAGWVAGRAIQYLRPALLPSRRALFERR